MLNRLLPFFWDDPPSYHHRVTMTVGRLSIPSASLTLTGFSGHGSRFGGVVGNAYTDPVGNSISMLYLYLVEPRNSLDFRFVRIPSNAPRPRVVVTRMNESFEFVFNGSVTQRPTGDSPATVLSNGQEVTVDFYYD